MSLPVTNLDDRRFQDLVDEAKRMIPELCPEWTNHNLSDPGVALIELFAWMTELTLYRLNQVPDGFYTRMLNLLGFEQFPATAARADVTFWLSGGASHGVSIPAGTQVTTAGRAGDDVRVFTTLHDVRVDAPSLTAAMTALGSDQYIDVWDELSLGLELITCFPREPLTPGDSFYLGFDKSLAGQAVRLDFEASLEGIGVIPARPPIVWEAWQGGGWMPLSVPQIPDDRGGIQQGDTTGGLNRNGSILLLVPGQHEPLTLGGQRAYWVRARLLPSSATQPGYRSSPQVRKVSSTLVGATVEAEHSDIIGTEVLGTSNGRPDQTFTVSRRPVLPREPHERVEVMTPSIDADGRPMEMVDEWTEVTDFVDSTATDRHFTWDSFTGEVRFGPRIRYPDGTHRQHGDIPAEGTTIRVVGYRTGGGAAGNVGASTLTSMRTSIPYVTGVTNLEPASGGVDPETIDNAKRRGPQSVRAGGRAVTISDFERLAAESDGRIKRVRCLPPREPGDPVRLLVVPHIEEPPETLVLDHFALPDDMIERLSSYLDERRVLGSTIEIGTPYYQGVTAAVLLDAKPGRPTNLIRERAMHALYEFINPIHGGPHRTGWGFDVDLNATQVFQLLEAVEGVERVEEVLFFEYDLRNQERLGFGKELVKLGPDSLFLSTNHQVVVR